MQAGKNHLHIKIKQGCPFPLGVSKCADGINFAVIVSGNKSCKLLLFFKGTPQIAARITLKEDNAAGDIRAVCLQGLEDKKYEYIFEIDGKEQLDIYARKIVGKTEGGYRKYQRGEIRCGFSFESYECKKDYRPELALEDVILYRMHVRGFTKHYSSKVEARGTFRGLMEKITYLKELGVNQIEVMPIYEFNECFREGIIEQAGKYQEEMRLNYWGYAQENYYFAPKGGYALSHDPETELKDLISELHANGMEFIMEFYFPGYTPHYLISDALHYWVLNYHVDGFHISGESVSVDEIALDPFFSKTKLYYEKMDSRKVFAARDSSVQIKHLAQCCDDYLISMRRFLKGDAGCAEQAAYFTRRNEKQHGYINYITGHNGFTMLDMVSFNFKHNEENKEKNLDGWNENFSWNCGVEGKTRRVKINEIRKRQMKNAWVLLMMSQGIPAILAGDEYCNSQNGNNNAYCQDNNIGWVQWQEPVYFKDMPRFVKNIIAFRKKHSILHSSEGIRVMDYLAVGYPDVSYHGEKAWYVNFNSSGSYIGILYCGSYAKQKDGREDDFIFAALNMNWKNQDFAIPKLPKGKTWYCAIDTGCNEEGMEFSEKILEDQRILTVDGRTIVILLGK